MATIEELNIKISADIKGLKRGVGESNRRLKTLGKTSKKQSKELDKNLKSLGGRFQNLASSIAVVEGPLGGVAGRFGTIAALLKRVNVATILAIASFAGLVLILGKSLKLLIPFETTLFRLGAVLRATGRDAETSVAELDQFAIQLGAATLTSREAVLEAVAALATFNTIKTDQFEKILTIAQDVSAVFGGDLKTNTIILARALTAPGEAFTILERKVGKFTEAEKKLLKELQDTGRIMEAQEILLAKLEGTTGAAEAAAKGLAGQIDTLGENFRRALIPLAKFSGFAFSVGNAITVLSFAFKKIADFGERFASAADIAGESVKNLDKDLKNLGTTGKKTFEDQLTPAANRAAEDIASGLSRAILESRNNLDSFGRFAEDLLNRIAQRILEVSITEPLVKGILGALNVKQVPGVGTTGKALGGQVQANRPVVVGEKGPELLIPNTSGNIVPNNKMGGGGITVTQNFNISSGAEINQIDQKIANAAPQIARLAQGGIIEAIQSGGTASKLVGRKF